MSAPDEVKEETSKVTVSDILFRGQAVSGCYGVEIEVEGSALPTELSHLWRVTRDGSLRGEAYEYVFSSPLNREDAKKALSQLYRKLAKARWDDTGRAGVHVHMNVRDLDLRELLSFICLYLVFEEVLLDFCGEDRKGNLFCLQSDDAEYLMIKLKDFFETLSFGTLSTDALRYSSLNLTALKKYGSLEFRSLPSPVTEERLNIWIDLLTMIRNKAVNYADPRLIVTGVSEYGGEDFAKAILEDLISHLPCDNWNKAIFKGMRKIQPLMAYYDHERIADYEKSIRKSLAAKEKRLYFNLDAGDPMANIDMAMFERPQVAPPRAPGTRRINWDLDNPFRGPFEAYVLGEEE